MDGEFIKIITSLKDLKKVEEESFNLEKLFDMWTRFLFERIIRIFEWTGLPFPQREMERAAMLTGITYVAWHNADVGLVTGNGNVYGVTRYSDVYDTVIYSMPKEGGGTIHGKRKIGEKAVAFYNNSCMMGMVEFIQRYASLMTHADLTLRCALVNLRDQDVFFTGDSSTREAINAYYRDKYKGNVSAILDSSLMMTEGVGTANLAKSSYVMNIKDIVEVHNEILRMFYRDIGVRWAREKKGNMTSNEVESDAQLLLFNVSDMLACREEFCNEYNKVFQKFGVAPISVKLSNDFELVEEDYEEETGDSSDDSGEKGEENED